ncbi:MAG: undecaprenyl-diphosphate phosphatase [Pseudomonadota bacterium]
MELIHIIVLAIVQGLTEFLPVSSSAHLILVPRFLGWEDQGLAFDVAVHVGTLTAVVWYFRKDLRTISAAWLHSLSSGTRSRDSRLAWAVLLGTIPVGLCGLLFGDFIETTLRSPMVIAGTTIGFGVLLWLADLWGPQRRDEHHLDRLDILLVGCAQALALIPGTSRSGITMTAALALGLTRSGAARFSFLLSIPLILLAGGLETVKLVQSEVAVDWLSLLLGTLLSALSAYLCIRLFLSFLERVGMLPFAVYRLLLGIVIILTL